MKIAPLLRYNSKVGPILTFYMSTCVVAAILCGCYPKKESVPELITGPQITAENATSFAADALPYTNAALILAGKPLPVKLSSKRTGPVVTFALDAYGQTVEEEVYRNGANVFEVERVSGEKYLPPIPLLKFPAKTGEQYKWSGEMVSGEQARKAKANVLLSGDRLNLFGGQFDSLQVTVNLEMESGGPEPAVRKMSFWFVPGKGIVRREFGFSSTREPAPPNPIE